ncbi:glycerol-3-phosphate dehydrogenase [Haematobacter missouriensis]|uniref:FAD-binding oxidoreductase n=1 Tax=Haematobacter missouriensis TaxID=366616 RepID=A0A212ATF8_9RHOB|nr:FAD-dependent oxidoreductase [Haematobacter missouriensis]KFI26287.1 glycerol-3-phosphate dehydrogenase [Haematobacter missouriensis]OWJ78023.1 FAD-binding oxidoreductase [Haematobacter missouriensis]OWJ84770.1 FAD-binding oxidoreductase [Haematobacter missouriensis]
MDSDFLIIGGGIAGISAAARLSYLGRVIVLEAEPHLAYHASGRSAALYEEGYGAPAVVALNRASKDYHFDPARELTTPRGVMIVGRAGEEDLFRADAAQMHLFPVTLEEARTRVPVLNPETVAHVAVGDGARDIDTDRLVQAFAREARGNGALIVTSAPVDTIRRRSGGGWDVQSGARGWSGRILVNAAGAWVDRVAALAGVTPLGFTPYRRSMARIPAPGGHDVSGWPMIFGAGETWYAKPDAGKLIVSPADEDPAEPHDAYPDDMVLAEGLARYEEMVTTPVTRVESSWAGLRTFAPDRVLVIGFDPRVPDFFWQAGQGGYGFQTSPAASRLAADLVGGTASELDAATVAALSPARF